MPVYVYEHHEATECPRERVFEIQQSMQDDAFSHCPDCGGAVRRLICAPAIATPRTNTELKNMGFTKLVRRDKGVYENVTAVGGESRVMEAGKPETMPHIHKRIQD